MGQEEAPSWYYLQGEQPVGPATFEHLRQLGTAGRFGPTDQVWQEGMAAWQPAASIPGLFSPGAGPTELPPPVGGSGAGSPADAAGRKRAERAARWSWQATLLAFAANTFVNVTSDPKTTSRSESLGQAAGAFLAYVFGLCCGIYALRQVRRYGRAKIRAGALTGTILNGLIILGFIGVVVFFHWLR